MQCPFGRIIKFIVRQGRQQRGDIKSCGHPYAALRREYKLNKRGTNGSSASPWNNFSAAVFAETDGESLIFIRITQKER